MTRVVLTYADYAALPDDGRRYELHEGELVVTPAPSTRHQRVIGNLYVILRGYLRARPIGEVLLSPTDCIMSDITVVQPDLVYIGLRDASLVSERAIEGAPTLAIEVSSPSRERIDHSTKLRLYARHGVIHYWIVDPSEQAIDAYTLKDGAYHLAARLTGERSLPLPPFDDLPIDPAAVWA